MAPNYHPKKHPKTASKVMRKPSSSVKRSLNFSSPPVPRQPAPPAPEPTGENSKYLRSKMRPTSNARITKAKRDIAYHHLGVAQQRQRDTGRRPRPRRRRVVEANPNARGASRMHMSRETSRYYRRAQRADDDRVHLARTRGANR